MENLLTELSLFNFIILILILFRTIKGKDKQFRGQKEFVRCVLVALLMLIFNIIWNVFELGILSSTKSIYYLTNILYFSFSDLLAYYWFIYSEHVQGRYIKSHIGVLISKLPIYSLILITIASIKTQSIFYLEGSTFYIGNLYFLQPLITYGYILYTSTRALVNAYSDNNYIKRYRYLYLAIFGYITSILNLIQVYTSLSGLYMMGITLGFLLIHLSIMDESVSTDSFTKLGNRNAFNQDLESIVKSTVLGNLYLLIIDIDYFKRINDIYGRREGDNVIKDVSSLLYRYANSMGFSAYRYGGDKFALLAEVENKNEIVNICKKLKLLVNDLNKNRECKVSLSIGYSKYTDDMSIEELIDNADDMLTKVKKHRN